MLTSTFYGPGVEKTIHSEAPEPTCGTGFSIIPNLSCREWLCTRIYIVALRPFGQVHNERS